MVETAQLAGSADLVELAHDRAQIGPTLAEQSSIDLGDGNQHVAFAPVQARQAAANSLVRRRGGEIQHQRNLLVGQPAHSQFQSQPIGPAPP